MRLCVKDGVPISRINPKDNRKTEYLVQIWEKKKWISRKRILTLLDCFEIENAELHGNKITIIVPKLKIEKINNTNIKKIFSFCKNYLATENNYDYYDNSFYYFQSILEDKKTLDYLLSYGYVIFNGNQLECILNESKELGVSLIHTPYYKNYKNLYKCFELLSKKKKNSVFYCEYLNETLKEPFKVMNFESRINKNKTYNFYHGSYITEYDTNLFRDYIEKKYFPNIDINKLKICCVKGKELEKYYKKFQNFEFSGTWSERSSMPTIMGFTYFCLDDFYNRGEDKNFLLALYDDIIVGVIKFGIWTDHQSVAYIDVNEKYRQLGISKILINNLDKYVDKNYSLVLTDESKMGSLCRMAEAFKKGVKSVKVKTYHDCIKTGSYN